MTRPIVRNALLAAVVALASFTFTSAVECATEGCGFKPLKPLKPIGCKDLIAECRCDAEGRNCRWDWICVPR